MSWFFEDNDGVKTEKNDVVPLKKDPIIKVERPAEWPKPPSYFGTIASTVKEPTIDTSSNSMYGKLKSLTDFDNTDVGQILNKYLLPLASVNLDEATKFDIAMKQAAAHEGLTKEKVLSTFDGLNSILITQQNGFNTSVNSFEAGEIQAKKEAIGQVTAQINDLSNQLTKLSMDVAAAQSKEDNTKKDFNAAMSLRTSELNTQKAKYQSILKG